MATMSGFRVSITTNADSYAAAMRVRAGALIHGCEETGEQIGKIAMERAHWWSSGPYKQKELTRMGHPYAKRHHEMADVVLKRGRGYQRTKTVNRAMRIGEGFPARINIQTGDFLQGWHYKFERKAGTGDVVGVLSNTSEHAKYLTRYGTTYMIPRPVMQRIMADTRRAAQPFYGRLLKTAIAKGRVSSAQGGAPNRPNLMAAFRRGFQRGLALGTGIGGI